MNRISLVTRNAVGEPFELVRNLPLQEVGNGSKRPVGLPGSLALGVLTKGKGMRGRPKC